MSPMELKLQARWQERKTRATGVPEARVISGAKESRTPDLLSAIQALYQLSYSPAVTRVRGDGAINLPR
jgi:hypothetical protein